MPTASMRSLLRWCEIAERQLASRPWCSLPTASLRSLLCTGQSTETPCAWPREEFSADRIAALAPLHGPTSFPAGRIDCPRSGEEASEAPRLAGGGSERSAAVGRTRERAKRRG